MRKQNGISKRKIWAGCRTRFGVVLMVACVMSTLSVQALAAKPMTDRPGFKDPSMYTRMPNYYLAFPGSQEEKQYAAHEFTVMQDNKPGR